MHNDSKVTRSFKKCCFIARSGRNKTVDSDVAFQAMGANAVRNIRNVSGKITISQSSVVCHLHDHGKSGE